MAIDCSPLMPVGSERRSQINQSLIIGRLSIVSTPVNTTKLRTGALHFLFSMCLSTSKYLRLPVALSVLRQKKKQRNKYYIIMMIASYVHYHFRILFSLMLAPGCRQLGLTTIHSPPPWSGPR